MSRTVCKKETDLGFATVSDLARRWSCDRATALKALKESGVPRSPLHMSPRYSWNDILEIIEKWPHGFLQTVDVTEPLRRAEELADILCVTPQTIRNYGKAGKLHAIRITARAIRYCPAPCENQSEAKAA